MTIDPARLRPLDRLRLLEQLAENSEWLAVLHDWQAAHHDGALYSEDCVKREYHRLHFLAARDLQRFIDERKEELKQLTLQD